MIIIHSAPRCRRDPLPAVPDRGENAPEGQKSVPQKRRHGRTGDVGGRLLALNDEQGRVVGVECDKFALHVLLHREVGGVTAALDGERYTRHDQCRTAGRRSPVGGGAPVGIGNLECSGERYTTNSVYSRLSLGHFTPGVGSPVVMRSAHVQVLRRQAAYSEHGTNE